MSFSIAFFHSSFSILPGNIFAIIIHFYYVCSPMIRETGVQSEVKLYWRLKKLALRYIWGVEWINLGKGVALCRTPRCSSYWKGSLQVSNFIYLNVLSLIHQREWSLWRSDERALYWVNLISSCTMTLTFGLITFGNVWNPFIPPSYGSKGTITVLI